MTEHNPSLDPRVCYMRGCRNVTCVDANTEYIRRWRSGPSGIAYARKRSERDAQARAQRRRDQAATAVD